MELKIEIHYYGGGEEYPATTELVNKTHRATGFIPEVGDQIFLEEEDLGETEKEEDIIAVSVVQRWVQFSDKTGSDVCTVSLHVSFQSTLIAQLNEDAESHRPRHYYNGN